MWLLFQTTVEGHLTPIRPFVKTLEVIKSLDFSDSHLSISIEM